MNWSPNQVPGPTSDVVITQAGNYTVVVGAASSVSNLTGGAASGTQTLFVSATLTLNGTSVLSSNTVLNLAGGTIQGAGRTTVNGLVVWTGGSLYGAMTIATNGVLNMSGAAIKYLYGVLTNAGTVTWTGTGDLNFWTTGASLYNLGGALFDVQNDARLYTIYGGTGFYNAGQFRKSAGSGTNMVFSPFRNSGRVDLQVGTLNVGGAFNQTAGATLLKGGNMVVSGTLPIGGGLLGGAGQVFGNVNLSGQLSPGLSVGRVQIIGSYAQSGVGSYNVELGGTIAGTNYDQVSITGSAQLAGTFNVISINGFVPALGDRFEIMKFASKSGSVTFQGLDITNGIYLQPVFSPTNLVLVATNAPLSASPKFNLAHNGDSLWLWWPLGYGGFRVQSTTNLNTPIQWSNVSLTETNRSIFAPSGPTKFFRMVSP